MLAISHSLLIIFRLQEEAIDTTWSVGRVAGLDSWANSSLFYFQKYMVLMLLWVLLFVAVTVIIIANTSRSSWNCNRNNSSVCNKHSNITAVQLAVLVALLASHLHLVELGSYVAGQWPSTIMQLASKVGYVCWKSRDWWRQLISQIYQFIHLFIHQSWILVYLYF